MLLIEKKKLAWICSLNGAFNETDRTRVVILREGTLANVMALIQQFLVTS